MSTFLIIFMLLIISHMTWTLDPLCRDTHLCDETETWSFSCSCDSDCSIYGDCCIDSKHRNQMKSKHRPMECINHKYIKTTCLPDWENRELKYRCETYRNASDILSTAPVISLDTSISYRNYHCAVCNNDEQNIQLWKMRTRCKPIENTVLDENFFQNLEYNERHSTWGGWHRNAIGQRTFIPCIVENIPEVDDRNIIIRRCKNSISDCPIHWNDDDVRTKCKSYQGIIYIDDLPYRNEYCALCNGANIKDAKCRSTPISGLAPGDGNLDFSSVFRFKIQRCSRSQIYDPILKVCHQMTCGFDNLELKNGKCVRKTNGK